MKKLALLAVVGICSLALPVFAQHTELVDLIAFRPTAANAPDALRTLEGSYRGAPWLGSSNRFSLATSFGWMDSTPHFLPALGGGASPRANVQAMPSDDSLDKIVLTKPSSIYVGGEVGFLYGVSTGKYGRETEAGYIVGEVGNEHFHFTVGASHEETSGRIPRYAR